jgi:hypothetical protein
VSSLLLIDEFIQITILSWHNYYVAVIPIIPKAVIKNRVARFEETGAGILVYRGVTRKTLGRSPAPAGKNYQLSIVNYQLSIILALWY